MKQILITTILLILFSWKIDSSKTNTLAISSCQDSTIVNLVTTENQLFYRSYALSDSINEGVQISLIEKLISLDSIPDSKYSPCSSESEYKWILRQSHNLVDNDLLNEVFKDSYILGGKKDNYQTLKEVTGKDGIMYLSRIYYSEDMKNAIVSIDSYCGWSCGQSILKYYAFDTKIWNQKMTFILSET